MRRRHASALIPVIAVACVACGSESGGRPSSGGSGGLPGSGGTGGVFEWGGAGGVGGTGGMTTGGSPNATGGTAPSPCEETTLSGRLDGQPFTQTYYGGEAITDRGYELRREFGSASDGLIDFIGAGNESPSDFTGGEAHATIGGFVLMPAEGPLPGSFVCGNANATIAGDVGGLYVDVPAASVLGACPGGTPVSGEIHLCAEFNQAECDLEISGSIESIPLEDAKGSSGIGGNGLFEVTARTLDGVRVRGLLDRPPLEDPIGQVIGGFITTSPNGPHGGAIYCIGSGTFEYVDGGASRMTAQDLTKLGSCSSTGSGSDELSICIPR